MTTKEDLDVESSEVSSEEINMDFTINDYHEFCEDEKYQKRLKKAALYCALSLDFDSEEDEKKFTDDLLAAFDVSTVFDNINETMDLSTSDFSEIHGTSETKKVIRAATLLATEWWGEASFLNICRALIFVYCYGNNGGANFRKNGIPHIVRYYSELQKRHKRQKQEAPPPPVETKKKSSKSSSSKQQKEAPPPDVVAPEKESKEDRLQKKLNALRAILNSDE